MRVLVSVCVRSRSCACVCFRHYVFCLSVFPCVCLSFSACLSVCLSVFLLLRLSLLRLSLRVLLAAYAHVCGSRSLQMNLPARMSRASNDSHSLCVVPAHTSSCAEADPFISTSLRACHRRQKYVFHSLSLFARRSAGADTFRCTSLHACNGRQRSTGRNVS